MPPTPDAQVEWHGAAECPKHGRSPRRRHNSRCKSGHFPIFSNIPCCACSDCSAGNCQKVRCNIPRNKPLFPLIVIIICPFSTLATILQPHIMVQICLHTYLIWTAPFAPAFPSRALSHSFSVGQLTRKLFQPYNDTHQAGVRLFDWEGFKAVSVPCDIFV